MNNIKLNRCDVVKYVKDTLYSSKTDFVEVKNARYHHTTKYSDACSIIKCGILTTSELNRLKIKSYSPEFLEILNDTSSQVNGLDGVSLAVTGLDDLCPDEDEFDPFLSDAVDFRIADTLSPRPGRDSTKYGNEFIYRGIIKPEEFRAIDISLLKYMYELEHFNPRYHSVEKLIDYYNDLLDIVKSLKDANLDIPIREVSSMTRISSVPTEKDFCIDKEKMSERPRILIK